MHASAPAPVAGRGGPSAQLLVGDSHDDGAVHAAGISNDDGSVRAQGCAHGLQFGGCLRIQCWWRGLAGGLFHCFTPALFAGRLQSALRNRLARIHLSMKESCPRFFR